MAFGHNGIQSRTCRDEKGQLWDDYDSLVDVIIRTVVPESWEVSVGGPGSIEGKTFASAKVLVIRQTNQVHQEVTSLLDTIRAIAKAHGTDSQPPLRKQPTPCRFRSMHGRGGNAREGGCGQGCSAQRGSGMM